MPMGAAPMAFTLWTKFMRHNPSNPRWPNRDRFILSAGHGSALLYSMLHLTGYDLSMDDIKDFRQWGSRTPGHPENHITPGVEVTTGPLGQGISNAVGMAIAEAHLAAKFNRPGFSVLDHYTYVIASDGDLMEGVASEACSLAGHLGLGKLIVLYDDNHISIDGSTDLAFTEDRMGRFSAYGWHTLEVADGNDTAAIAKALGEARGEEDRPSIIAVRTHIGYGSPNKQDTADAHGSPLGEEEVRLTKENLGWPSDQTFLVPDEVRDHFRQVSISGQKDGKVWDELFADYKKEHPDLAAMWKQMWSAELPKGWQKSLPDLSGQSMATRAASGKVINALAHALPRLLGGSADLAPSKTRSLTTRGPFRRKTGRAETFTLGSGNTGWAPLPTGCPCMGRCTRTSRPS